MVLARDMGERDVNHSNRFCPACFEAFDSSVELCPEDGSALVTLQHHDESIEGHMLDGKYRVGELLGRGGMGEVYRARQLPIDREVAIKVLYEEFLRTPQDVKRFVREASAASRMKTRYAAMVHDFGIAQEGFIYLTMELVEGNQLSTQMVRDTTFGVERSLHVAIDICHAVEDAHSNGIVHRDLKPGNVMLREEDGHEIARVLDFGTARIVDGLDDDRLTDEGKVFGTPEYMCPEQAMGDEVDARADLYSLGIMLYEMLTGKLPFTGKSHTAVLLNHINRAAKPMTDVAPDVTIPPRLVDLVGQLMAKKASDRPTSARSVREELEDILTDVAGAPIETHKKRFRTGKTALPKDGVDPPPVSDIPTSPALPRQQTMEMFGEEFYGNEVMSQHFPTSELEVLERAPDPRQVEEKSEVGLQSPAPHEADVSGGHDIWDPITGEILEISSLPSLTEEAAQVAADEARSGPSLRLVLGIVGVALLLTIALALTDLI